VSPPNVPAGLGAIDSSPPAVLESLAARIRAARALGTPLAIVGGGTKAFLDVPAVGEPLRLVDYRGVIAHAPSELVIEVRAGTPLGEIEALLAEHGQEFAFEPPRFGDASTIGGVISAGLSGPGRPWTGALRDHVLGVVLLGDDGLPLRFGGRVMKNVAGYDVPRLVAGAWGTLGPIAELALRVAPRPACRRSLAWLLDERRALAMMAAMSRASLPLAGACFDGECLRVRLAGSREAVDEAIGALRPERVEEDLAFWEALRDFRLGFFADPRPLWRLSVPPAAAPLTVPGAQLVDWGGAQRWLKTDVGADAVQAAARRVGGHAQPFFAAPATAPLPRVQQLLQARIRAAFRAEDLFNPGRTRVGG
jgi:glycolate oxidase FAD binding subunit